MKIRTKHAIRHGIVYLTVIILLITGFTLFANWKIPHNTKAFVFDSTDSIPSQKAALVLGTAKNIGNRPNLYFTYRIAAAQELYKAGKVKNFVVSGDNSHQAYNEAEDMKNALIEAGVPDSIIYMDHAGFRTLDSVVRMNKIFGQSSFIVVSQQFHNERAIFLAQYYGYSVYGYNAQDVSINRFSVKTKVREIFARVKVFVDMAINKNPKFLGEQINIK